MLLKLKSRDEKNVFELAKVRIKIIKIVLK